MAEAALSDFQKDIYTMVHDKERIMSGRNIGKEHTYSSDIARYSAGASSNRLRTLLVRLTTVTRSPMLNPKLIWAISVG